MSWHTIEDDKGKFFYYQPSKKVSSNKILGLDLDATLIKNESGKPFPINADDWFFPHSIDKLVEYSNKGYKIVIFTNQKGVFQGKGNLNYDDFKNRCNQITSILESKELSVYVLGSTQDDFYRKPSTGMWNYMEKHLNNGVKIHTNDSIFVGDAAGRKGDFSDSDIKFAINIGCNFMTPEEFFEKSDKFPFKTLSKNLKGFNPVPYIDDFDKKERDSVHKENQESLSELADIFKDNTKDNTKDNINNVKVILMVGSPASGKTSLTKVIKDKIGGEILSLDDLKTKTKMKSKLKELLPLSNVIIDSTNATIKQRTEWLEMVGKVDDTVKVVCVYLNVPKEITVHLNNLRQIKSVIAPDYHSKNVPIVAIHTFWKKFEKPTTTNENFYKIVEFKFEPIFKTKDEKKEFLTLF